MLRLIREGVTGPQIAGWTVNRVHGDMHPIFFTQGACGWYRVFASLGNYVYLCKNFENYGRTEIPHWYADLLQYN